MFSEVLANLQIHHNVSLLLKQIFVFLHNKKVADSFRDIQKVKVVD